MKALSLFSGGGGLDMAAEMLWPGLEHVAFVENDVHASSVLARHWPDVPNLGDITAIDWSQVGPVDVIVGGFPCQDISTAGKRAGISEGTRSGLWFYFRDAIRTLRPRYVLLENVAAIATAGGGLDVVLGSLAEVGFDAEWGMLRASDVGAPHRRERWFCVAYPDGPGLEGWTSERRAYQRLVGADRMAASDSAGDGWSEGRTGAGERPRDTGLAASDRGTTADANQPGCEALHRRQRARNTGRSQPVVRGATDWGDKTPAIRRWESILGRPAPPPLDDRGRLNAPFVEWMMGWPEGHTNALSRNKALKVLGNGVVPQQAVAAYTQLLARVPAEEVAA